MFNAKSFAASKRKGYRSGLEVKVQKDLQSKGVVAKYEPLKIDNKILKGSKTTYADWCNRYGFLYHLKLIPSEWIDEDGSSEKVLTFIPFPGEKK